MKRMGRVFVFFKSSHLSLYSAGLILLTALGGFLRFYSLDWDSGLFFHPDERNIAAAVSRIHFFDQLDPGFFAYGGLLIYTYRAVGELVSFITQDPSWVSSWGNINIIGRFTSALFSTLTIPAVYLLTRTVFEKKILALFASLIAAFTVSFIQTAHYATTESLLTFLSVVLALLSLRLLRRPTLPSYLVCGLVYGLAVATKMSGLSILVFPLTAHLLVVFGQARSLRVFFHNGLLLIAFLAISGLVFVVFSPYTFLDWGAFMESMRYESRVATGKYSVPYTLQFTHTLPYLFQLKNLFWQLGPIAFFSIFGFVLLPFVWGRRNPAKLLLFFSFPTIYFLYVGSWHAKFIRFMVPILPFLIIAASVVLFSLYSRRKLVGGGFIVLLSVSTVLWALAFFSIYRREQTRIAASRWIYQHIPSGSRIFGEHWDDGLPVSLPHSDLSPSRYDIEQLTIYEPDTEEKLDYFAEKLFLADYLVINSRRLYGTLIHLEERYPLTSRYYSLLFSGKLGYEKVAEFTSYPSLFGVTINDDASEETFQVYDHPKVMIFAKTRLQTQDRFAELLRDEVFPTLR